MESTTVAELVVELAYKQKNNPTSAIKKIQKSINGLSKSTEDSDKKTSKLFASLKRIATYRALRTALKAIVSSFKEGTNNLYAWSKAINGDFAKSMDSMSSALLVIKNSLGLAIAPLLQGVVIPLIEKVSIAIANGVNWMSELIATMKGASTYTKVLTTATKEYAKTQRQLLGFDELNILGSKDSADAGSYFKETETSDKFKGVGDAFAEIKKIIKDNLDEIETALALAPLALGIILCATGNWGAGLGFLTLGEFASAVATNGLDEVVGNIKNSLADVMQFMGWAAAAVGMILMFVGYPSLGLGLLITGYATYATTTWGKNFDIIGDIKAQITELMVVLGASSLALGALLFFTGANMPLGLGLMVAGLASLGTSVAINWDDIVSKVKDLIDKVTTVVKNGFDKLKTFFEPILTAAKNLVTDIIDSIKTDFTALADWFKNTWLYKTFVSMKNWISDKLVGGKDYTYDNIFEGADLYASGGFPQQGSMFIAGESGAEFVGNIGGRTGVYNTDQLAGSLASANETVVSAIFQAVNSINNTINNQPTPSIKIGDREIYQASQRGSRLIGSNLVQGV